MENELGFPLVERTSKIRFSLTPAGRRFKAFADETIQSYKTTLHDCMRMQNQIKTRISIGIEQFDLHLLSYQYFDQFYKEHKNIDFSINYSMHADLLNHLYNGDYDAVFLAEPETLPEGYIFLEICSDDFACVVSHDNKLYDAEKICLADLNNTIVNLPEPAYTDFSLLKKKMQMTNTEFGTYRTIHSMISHICITNYGKRNLFHTLHCIPLEIDLRIHLGFIIKKNASVLLYEMCEGMRKACICMTENMNI